MTALQMAAHAKLNVFLRVLGRRDDGYHDVETLILPISLADDVTVEPADELTLSLEGPAAERVPADDMNLALRAARALAAEAGGARPLGARISIHKRIPVAAGLGGGSSDAATALRLANASLAEPVSPGQLAALAGRVGSDVPFFLAPGPQLGEGDGTTLTPLDLPQDYWIVLVLPHGEAKVSTAAVYEAFDRRDGARGHAERRSELLAAVERVRRPRDLAALPANDLASSPLADELRTDGAFRADVSGAGPAVYGLFHHRAAAEAARRRLAGRGRTWLTVPAWYG